MIPLSDADRKPLRFPAVTAAIIAVNVFIFLLELSGGKDFIFRWAVFPADLTSGQNYITILSAMFMHGSILHIAGNMLFLWVFGPEMEDAMGRAKYLVFYLLGGLTATIAQVVPDPYSNVPELGASGAIAAVMGAFLVTYPRDRIRTVLLIGWYVTVTLVPAIFLVGLWFLMQLVSEVGSLVERHSGGIAYMAHIGGMIFGIATARVFGAGKKKRLK